MFCMTGRLRGGRRFGYLQGFVVLLATGKPLVARRRDGDFWRYLENSISILLSRCLMCLLYNKNHGYFVVFAKEKHLQLSKCFSQAGKT